MTKAYELVIIYKPTISTTYTKTKLMETLKSKGIIKILFKNVGLQQLAYEMKGFKQGYYITAVFETSEQVAHELQELFRKKTNILKHIILECPDFTEREVAKYESIILNNHYIDAVDVMLGLAKYIK